MDRLLYFPLASPPDAVAMQAALYWDTLYTMTPEWYDFRSPLLRTLHDAEVVQQIHLDDLLGRPQLLEPIIREVHHVLSELPGEDLEPDPRLHLDSSTRLYEGKLPRSVQYELQELGAVVSAGHREMLGTPSALGVIMSVMAAAAARTLDSESSGRSTALLTDQRRSLRQAVGALPSSRHDAWQLQVGSVLPVPAPGTDPDLILRFRNEYADERRRLSVALTRLATSLSPAGVVDVPQLLAEVQQAERDIVEAGRSRNMHMVRRGLLLGTSLAAAVAAATVGLVELEAVANVLAGAGVGYASAAVRQEAAGDYTYLAQLHRHFPS